MADKIEVDLNQHVFLVYPRQCILVTSKHEDDVNIITLAWSTVLSHNPPMQGIAISPERYSHDLIKQSRKFIINIPTKDIIQQVVNCGRVTGLITDKFRQFGLTPLESIAFGKNGPPRIAECP
ncbi:MAG: flavin reductase family protein, partial [Promethearchaeota archaeon]